MNDQCDHQDNLGSNEATNANLRLQPNSNNCFVCGLDNPYGLKLKFFERKSGEVISEYTVPEQFQGYPGVVHGGVVAAMLDETAGRALMGGDPPRFMYTARLDLRFRKKVPVGQPLKLVGRMNMSKGRTAKASSFIYDSSGSLLAEANALLIDVPEEVVSSVDLEALGWRISSEEG
jgi:acyl-coenzyme A thioesterase PaaI-like protein